MAKVILIFLCLIIGIIIRRYKILDEGAAIILNKILIYISLPALAILYIPKIEIKSDVVFPVAVMWIVFFGSIGFILLMKKIFKWDNSTTGSLIMTSGLCNSSFVGFPVLLASFGEEGLKTGVIIDQSGSFFVLATAGVIVSSIFSRSKFSLKEILKSIIIYPPFIGFIIGLVLRLFNITHSEISDELFTKLGSPIFVLALISVGMQLRLGSLKDYYKELSIGLFYKLLIAPFIIFILYFIIFKQNSLTVDVSLMESAMPPMVMGAIMASSYNLNPKLSNLMVGVGIPISAVTLSFWYYIIKLI
ncbi:MAG: AEC family transporter [Ignavibacteria bacterium]|nr:AEC family transporter [Ignavibacteria bacterium]